MIETARAIAIRVHRHVPSRMHFWHHTSHGNSGGTGNPIVGFIVMGILAAIGAGVFVFVRRQQRVKALAAQEYLQTYRTR